jgi:hypothetical protein
MLNGLTADLLANFLDGRLGGVIGNTIDQSLFGNNISTTIGQGIEFNIDWMGYYFEGKSLPSALGLMAALGKNPALNMHTGFFSYTVGDSVELSSNGKLWDLARDVNKTEFGLDHTTLTPAEQAKLSLEPYINFIFFFNLFTTAVTQILSTVSTVLGETESNQSTVEQAGEIITILELVLYLVVPLVNGAASKLITEIEILFANLKKNETEDAQQEARMVALETRASTLEQETATISATTTVNAAALQTVEQKVEQLSQSKTEDAEHQGYLAKWNIEMAKYHAELVSYNSQMETYNKKQQAYKASYFRQGLAMMGKKAYQPEAFKPGNPPVKPVWAPPNITKYPNAP